MTRRSPEQVHDEDGHKEFVASCGRCATEAEQDQNAEAARAELAAGGVIQEVTVGWPGEHGPEVIVPGSPRQADDAPLPDADPAGAPDDAEELPARRALTGDGRPKCYVEDCPLPEFAEDIGLCGGHWSNRPDLRKVARGD